MFSTNRGLEPLLATELRSIARNRGMVLIEAVTNPFARGAYVSLPETSAADWNNWPTKLSHHVLEPLTSFELKAGVAPLIDLRERFSLLYLPSLALGKSFRVTCQRIGKHDFSSEQAAAAAGAGIVDRYHAPVKLKDFDVNIRLDIHQDLCIVAEQLTRRSLSKRLMKTYEQVTSLKANVARAMVQLAELAPGQVVLDPFVGSGTLLMEAIAECSGLAKVLGIDIKETAVVGARNNILSLQSAVEVEITVGSAQYIREGIADIDRILANPPHGVRLGRKLSFEHFYKSIMLQVDRVLKPGGLMVILILKRAAFLKALRGTGLQIESETRIEMRGTEPWIIKLRKSRSTPQSLSIENS